ncbi:D-alanyl-D-alanine carboxypeptidase [bacterium]|nr:D-alanyl-D-alanine carboxypeptidase [bacterium]MBU1025203.1 D-alanyl-D-alanine carboxypeptidase [bacterium]
MKKLFAIILFSLTLIFIPSHSKAQEDFHIDCKGGAILLEFHTSKEIYAQDADKRWSPASITKIMTSIIALESGNLNEEIRFSANAVKQEKSNLGLKEGVRVPLYRLIEAMLVKSGNDASVAIAEHIAGSEDKFAELMNEKAKSLGMFNTNFTNASGLPDDAQYSTARDLAILSVYAMGRSEFSRIVGLSELEFINEDATKDQTLYTTNQLIGRHPLVDGIKTGFTNKARRCLAASAVFRDYKLISVVLGAENPQVWFETEKLLDYGFKLKDPLYPLYRDFKLEIPFDKENDEDTG